MITKVDGQVKLDGDGCVELYVAQAEHASEILKDPRIADDGGDYCDSAIDATRFLLDCCFQGEVYPDVVEAWLNREAESTDDEAGNVHIKGRVVPHLENLASDGICARIVDLDPPALAAYRD